MAAWTATAGLRAQSLPPPVTPGEFELEVHRLSESWQSAYAYEPPSLRAYYSIWAEKIGVARFPQTFTTTNEIPAAAGATTATFVHDSNYDSSHPEVIKPIANWTGSWYAGVRYSRITLERNWDAGGRESYALEATESGTGKKHFIKGNGVGGPLLAPVYPPGWPTAEIRLRQEENTQASARIGWFRWWPPDVDYRYLPGLMHYWYRLQPDGTRAVFHVDSYTAAQGGLREYSPIGNLEVAGTPGHGPKLSYSTRTEPLSAAATYFNLRNASAERAFSDGAYVLTNEAAANYHFSPEVATASKLRYKLGFQPGIARTITWAETFTPEGATEPADYFFISETVTAETALTQPHIIDPFEPGNPHRFGDTPGKYEILTFEGALSVDTNHDGVILPGVGPITPYTIANADQGALGADFKFRPNFSDDDSDGTPDATDIPVNGPGDLKDFIPVYLDIGQLLKLLPPDNGFTYRLKQVDGALNFAYTNLTQATALADLTGLDSGFGPDLDLPARFAPTIPVTAGGVDIFGGQTGSEAFRQLTLQNNGGVILIEARQATAQPLVLEISRNGAVVVEVRLDLLVINPQLAVDANRDGTIKLANEDASDATTDTKPYRFWLNDDIDREHVTNNDLFQTANEQDDLESISDGLYDWLENRIPCSRDLEDFSRLWVSTQGTAEAFRPKDGTHEAEADYYLGFQWADEGKTGDPAIKIYPAFESDGGTKYLSIPAVAVQQVNFAMAVNNFQPPEGRLVRKDEVFVIPPRYFANLSNAQPKTFFLFEGAGVGMGQLKLVILKKENGVFTKLHEGPGIWIDLQNIRNFYQTWTVGDNTTTDVHADVVPAQTCSPAFDSPTVPLPATEEEKDFILFVHGWNMTIFEKNRFAETTYKRLWWQGYKGRFGAFRWPTFYTNPDDPNGVGPPLDPRNFDASELNSWRSAAGLLKLLTALKDIYKADDSGSSRVRVLAHSHGNLATGEALRGAAGPVVHTYVAAQAAIAAHCYDNDPHRVPDISANWESAHWYLELLQHPEILNPFLTGFTGQALAIKTPNIYAYYPANQGLDSNTRFPTDGGPYMTGASGAGKWSNYYNVSDWALDGWITNQAFKPDIGYDYRFLDGSFADYNVTGWWFTRNLLSGKSAGILAIPEDSHEIFAFAAQGRSQPLGRQPGVMGLFNGQQVSWNAYGDKHPGHSAQFRSSIAERWEYWNQLLITFALKAPQ